jgi:hypothetical protein
VSYDPIADASSRAFIGDGMRAKGFGEVPMSAMRARDPATRERVAATTC